MMSGPSDDEDRNRHRERAGSVKPTVTVSRRRLGLATLAGVVGLAGCQSDEGDRTTRSVAPPLQGTASPTPTRRPTGTAEPTASETTPTDEPTPTLSLNRTKFPVARPLTPGYGPVEPAVTEDLFDERPVRLIRSENEWASLRELLTQVTDVSFTDYEFVTNTSFDSHSVVAFAGEVSTAGGVLHLRRVRGIGRRTLRLWVREVRDGKQGTPTRLLLVRVPNEGTRPVRAEVRYRRNPDDYRYEMYSNGVETPTPSPTPETTPYLNLTQYPSDLPTGRNGPLAPRARIPPEAPTVRLARTRREWERLRRTIAAANDTTFDAYQFARQTDFDRESLVAVDVFTGEGPVYLQLQSVSGVGTRSVRLRVRVVFESGRNVHNSEILFVRLPKEGTEPKRATVVLEDDTGTETYTNGPTPTTTTGGD